MHQRDAVRRAQARQRRLQLERLIHRFMNELLDDRLAPRTERAATKSSAEPAHPGETHAVRLEGVAIENPHAGVGEDLHKLRHLAGLVVMISEHRDDGNFHRRC